MLILSNFYEKLRELYYTSKLFNVNQEEYSDKGVRSCAICHCLERRLWLVHIYVQGPSLAPLMCTDALSTILFYVWKLKHIV